jgi:signal peptide peptidase-like 2B
MARFKIQYRRNFLYNFAIHFIILYKCCVGGANTDHSKIFKANPSQQQSRRDPKAVLEIEIYKADSKTQLQYTFFGSPFINGPFGLATSFDISGGDLDLHAIYLSSYGCDPYTKDKYMAQVLVKKKPFALFINRGQCSFLRKMENAANAGASALFIMNQVNSLYINDGQNNSRVLKDMCSVFAHVNSQEKLVCDDNAGVCNGGGGNSVTSGSETCASGICLPFRAKQNMQEQKCCLDDTLMPMYIDKLPNVTKPIPTIFVTVGDGLNLNILFNVTNKNNGSIAFIPDLDDGSKNDIYTPYTLSIKARAARKFDFGILVLGMIALFTIIVATYRSAKVERMLSNAKYGPLDRNSNATVSEKKKDTARQIAQLLLARGNQPESQKLTVRQVFAFVCFSGLSLGFIYFLVKLGVNIVTIFNIWFIGVTASAMDSLLINPMILKPYCPSNTLNALAIDTTYIKLAKGHIVRTVISLVVPIWWYLEMKNNTSYTWILQNILGGFVCCYIALILRVPNLRIGTICLSAFLLYDVFMVFFTPFIFGGESIMMEVATAGGRNVPTTQQTNTSVTPSTPTGGETYLTACKRNPGERLPLLMMAPHFNEWPAGYSMLGLGDIMIPSFFISLVLRFDYRHGNNLCCARKSKVTNQGMTADEENNHANGNVGTLNNGYGSNGVFYFRPTYWFVCIFFYSVALCLANLANLYELTIAGVKGQPALLWINPLLIIPTILIAKSRGQLGEFWYGTSNDQSNSNYSQANSEDEESLLRSNGAGETSGIMLMEVENDTEFQIAQ